MSALTRPENITLATATRCSCGENVTVSLYAGTADHFASCPRCYDPSEGSADTERVCGHGASIEDALWAWAEQHETVCEVEWVPNPMWPELEQQVAAESERQAGLGMTHAGSPSAATLH